MLQAAVVIGERLRLFPYSIRAWDTQRMTTTTAGEMPDQVAQEFEEATPRGCRAALRRRIVGSCINLFASEIDQPRGAMIRFVDEVKDRFGAEFICRVLRPAR